MDTVPSRRLFNQILFTRDDLRPGRTLLLRIGLVLALFAFVFVVLWLERDELKDNYDQHMTAIDVLYFAMVTITTVGYGDIVPVSQQARLVDAVFITPIRLFIWFIFLGTTYQLVVSRYREGYRMAKVQAALRDTHHCVWVRLYRLVDSQGVAGEGDGTRSPRRHRTPRRASQGRDRARPRRLPW